MAQEINALLEKRLGKKEPGKMNSLAQQSARGNLSSFAGVFGVTELSKEEKDALHALLESHTNSPETLAKDLFELVSITSEVKAISNQAALLHGERIKKAHNLLTRYKEGAFTAWLIETYGNRATPYNFWQYYEFYHHLPRTLHPKLEKMPRQAVYTLASRKGALEEKEKIVACYQGESKLQLLDKIRVQFPLEVADKRQARPFDKLMGQLKLLKTQLVQQFSLLSKKEKEQIVFELDQLTTLSTEEKIWKKPL